jgi:hypothetical protein
MGYQGETPDINDVHPQLSHKRLTVDGALVRPGCCCWQEHLQQCSVCDPAEQNCVKKSQNLWVWLRKMVLAAEYRLQWLVQRRSMGVYLPTEKI